jgi:hypothetical protein
MTAKEKFWAWYNERIVAAWYRSAAIYVGLLAAATPYLLDLLQAALDNWDLFGSALQLTALQKTSAQVFLLVVVLPIARAWKQKKMQTAVMKQAEEVGDVVVLKPEIKNAP